MGAFATAFATFTKGLLAFLEKNKAGLAALFAFLTGKKVQAHADEAIANKIEAEAHAGYAKNQADRPTEEEVIKDLRDGNY